MVHRIEIGFKIPDARAKCRKKWLKSIGFFNVQQITIANVYTIDKKFAPGDLTKICSLLANPVSQKVNINSGKHGFDAGEFAYVIEIGYLPGVTDNVAMTAKHAIEDLLKTQFAREENVYTSQITFIKGELSEKEALMIGQALANSLIQRIHVKNYKDYVHDHGMDMTIPQVKLNKKPHTLSVNLKVNEEELEEIGKKGIRGEGGVRRGPLALDLISMKAIKKYFEKLKRNPTDVELESLAQTWSEHCRHTIFANSIDNVKNGLFDTCIKAATEKVRKLKGKYDFCVSVFSDNSGAIEFD